MTSDLNSPCTDPQALTHHVQVRVILGRHGHGTRGLPMQIPNFDDSGVGALMAKRVLAAHVA